MNKIYVDLCSDCGVINRTFTVNVLRYRCEDGRIKTAEKANDCANKREEKGET